MAGSPRIRKPNSYTVADFQQEFRDDDACLDYLWRQLHSADGDHADCPKCGRPRRFHRVRSRQSYSCDTCGHHLHPTAGTIFEKSTTPLTLWFHAIFILSQTRCGISAKQLQREIGTTYKTSWRMFNLIRQLLIDDDTTPLTGSVEIDESGFGGRIRAGDRSRAETSTKRRQDAMAKIQNRPTIFARWSNVAAASVSASCPIAAAKPCIA
jgi:transposase-like protein